MANTNERTQSEFQWSRFRWPALAVVMIAASAIAVTTRPARTKAPQLRVTENPRRLEAPAELRKQLQAIPIESLNYPNAISLRTGPQGVASSVQLVQFREGVDCQQCTPDGAEPKWKDERLIPWEVFAHGEYVGPHRLQHVPEYRIRVDDQLQLIYRLTRVASAKPYELAVGDRIRVECSADKDIDRELLILPDGNVTLRLLGQIRAAGRSVDELSKVLEELYKKYYQNPSITVTPLQVDTKLEDLRSSVDSRAGAGGQSQDVTVSPDGTIQLPAIGNVPAQGLTIDELTYEINERYAKVVNGIEVQPRLVRRAPRFVFVVGEVRQPNRYQLEGPTTVMQAIALAGGWNVGGALNHIIVFRRTEDWSLVATRLDLRGALMGHRPCPADEIWLRDSDIVLVPKSTILRTDDIIDLIFTRGIYGVLPVQGMTFTFSKLSTL